MMLKNKAIFIFVVVGICSTFFRSVTQARAHHHHRHNEKKDTDLIEQNAMQFADMPELLAELRGDKNDDGVGDTHETKIEKRQVYIEKRQVSGEVSETHKSEKEKCETETKEKLINIYAYATVLHSDARDKAFVREKLKLYKNWHWDRFEDFKFYADLIFSEAISRRVDGINK